MAAGPAPVDRPRMDTDTFIGNFGTYTPHKTYLCYEWDVLEGDSRIPADQLKGFLQNQGAHTPGGPRHAELCFLDRIRSWGLDKNKHYSATLFISWSPCPHCAHSLVEFLGDNSHVSLRISAARIYDYLKGYEDGLRQLQAAGAQVSLMNIPDYQHCWETFVDHQGRPFQPPDDLRVHIQVQSQRLNEILGVKFPLPAVPLLPSLLTFSPWASFPSAQASSGSPAPSWDTRSIPPSLLTRSLLYPPTSLCPSVLPHHCSCPRPLLCSSLHPLPSPHPSTLHLHQDSEN